MIPAPHQQGVCVSLSTCDCMYTCICVCMKYMYTCLYMCGFIYTCVNRCMHVCVQMCECTCEYVWLHLHKCKCMCVHMCMNACILVYIYICMCIWVWKWVLVYMSACICNSYIVCVHVCASECMYVYMCVCVCKHVHIHLWLFPQCLVFSLKVNHPIWQELRNIKWSGKVIKLDLAWYTVWRLVWSKDAKKISSSLEKGCRTRKGTWHSYVTVGKGLLCQSSVPDLDTWGNHLGAWSGHEAVCRIRTCFLEGLEAEGLGG